MAKYIFSVKPDYSVECYYLGSQMCLIADLP